MSGLIFGQNHHIFVQTLGNPPIHASSGSPHGTTGDILDHGNIAKKAESFGLYTQEIDGHDVKAIYDAIQNAYAKKGVPSCIVLDTCKGKGATFAEPKHDHSSQPNEEQWAEALAAAEKALEDAKNA